MNTAHKLLLLLGGAGGGGSEPIEWLLRDEFTTDEAAPLTSPRTAEPGPGTLTLVQNDGQFSIAGEALDFPAQSTPAWNALGFIASVEGAGIARAAGRALGGTVQLSALGFSHILGWDADSSLGNTIELGLYSNTSSGQLRSWATNNILGIHDDLIVGTPYRLAIVLRSVGAFFLIKGGSFEDWTLLWVDNASSATPLFPALNNYNAAGSLDNLGIVDMGAPWNDDYGVVTQRLAGARSGGDTLTHTADCLIEFTVTTLPSAGQIEVRFRIQDASNYWQITVDSSGNLDLDEVVAGSPAQRGTSAGVITNGERVVIAAVDEAIRVYDGTANRISYTSAANFTTETDGELETLGTGGAVADLVSWPYALSEAAKAQPELFF